MALRDISCPGCKKSIKKEFFFIGITPYCCHCKAVLYPTSGEDKKKMYTPVGCYKQKEVYEVKLKFETEENG